MHVPFTKVYLQPLLVESSQGTIPSWTDELGNRSVATQVASSVAEPIYNLPGEENQIVKATFSSVPVISRAELVHEYRELGEALDEMKELDDESEWKIEPPVLTAAGVVAAGLMTYSVPAPRVFSHGPKSLVFNWERGTRNLYLTISENRISALVSSPERIERRIEMSYAPSEFLDPSRLLVPIRAAHLDEPAVLALPSGTSDFSDLDG